MHRMTHEEVLEAVQSRVARVSVSASAVRGSKAGTVEAARGFLRRLDLTPFGSDSAFSEVLDRSTDALRVALPRGVQHWGLARKLLDIFLRDCLYTTYLKEAFHLRNSEAEYEIPLDSITALHLKRAAGRGGLPSWPGVKNVRPSLNAQFQAAAEAEAKRMGIPRVHLDAVLWSQSRDDDGA